MAIYTEVSREQVETFLKSYELGELDRFEGIESGVSNTNYHLFTTMGRYILTLFEPHRVHQDELPYFLGYATHMAEYGIPSAKAIAGTSGQLYGRLAERPAAIMSFCEGNHPEEVTPEYCKAAAITLARMHKACFSFSQKQENAFGKEKWDVWAEELGEDLNDISFGLHAAMISEIGRIKHGWPEGLPRGVIHGDFFPDNLFFNDKGDVSGVIDFHFACNDTLVYDLAIMVNAWCFDDNIKFVRERYQQLMEGYESIRPLTDEEKRALPILFRAAALRFVLSRCEEVLRPAEGQMMPHDPMGFIKRLEFFQDERIAA